MSFDAASGFASLVWAPTGIALAALLLYGCRLWPAVMLGALIVNLSIGATVPVALGIATGNTLEAVAGAYILGSVFGVHHSLDRVRDVVAVAALGGGLCTMISATIGVASLALGGHVAVGKLASTWAAWWWGDLSGNLLVAPLLLTWSAPSQAHLIDPRPRRLERILLATVLAIVAGAVFSDLPHWTDPFRRPHVLIPLLMWAAIRFGPRAAATAVFAVGCLGLTASLLRQGPYVQPDLHQGLLSLQVYMSTAALAVLSLAAVSIERARDAALARAAGLYKGSILEAAPDAIVTLDDRGKIREFNASGLGLFGYRRAQVVDRELALQLISPAHRDRVREALADCVRSGDASRLPRRSPLTAVRGDGTEFPAEITLVAVPIEGSPGFTCFLRDLTVQRAAELEMERSRDELEERVEARTSELRELNLDLTRREEDLRKAQRLAHVGSFVWDIERNLFSCSDELYRIYGLEPQSPLSYQEFLEHIVPEDRPEVESIIDRHLARPQSFQFEARIASRSGPARILVFEAEVEVGAGGQAMLIGTCQDVTRQRQAERMHARLAAIVESSAEAIIGETMAGEIDSWNEGAARIYGYSADEALGQPFTLLVPDEHRGEIRGMFDRVRTGERLLSMETIHRRKDGSHFDASVSASPILDPAGHIIGLSTIARDVTEQKRIEASMQSSLKEKDVLLKEIHHRVKNNLQVVASLLNLQAHTVDDEELRRGFEDSQNRIQSMALVHQLLYYSRNLASIEFAEYLRELVDRLADSFGVSRNRIELRVMAADLHLDIDTAVPCGLIVNELVTNSLTHAFPAGRTGQIVVSVEAQSGTSLTLAVKDDGIGIADTRIERKRTLGMKLVLMLARQLRGTVAVSSEGGTIVSVTFPHRAAWAFTAGSDAPLG